MGYPALGVLENNLKEHQGSKRQGYGQLYHHLLKLISWGKKNVLGTCLSPFEEKRFWTLIHKCLEVFSTFSTKMNVLR